VRHPRAHHGACVAAYTCHGRRRRTERAVSSDMSCPVSLAVAGVLICSHYFHLAGFESVEAMEITEPGGHDPMYVVQARKPSVATSGAVSDGGALSEGAAAPQHAEQRDALGAPPSFESGQRCTLSGLSGRAELNGRVVTLAGWVDDKQR
jgi:hypothetical protein